MKKYTHPTIKSTPSKIAPLFAARTCQTKPKGNPHYSFQWNVAGNVLTISFLARITDISPTDGDYDAD